MAKNFPYFKFIATDWLTGNIVFEDLEAQGLFINICALYWQKDGILSIEEIEKRYKLSKTKRPLSEILQSLNEYFILEKGFISIEFLDEQLKDAKHISVVNSENGKKGAIAKALHKQQLQATAKRPLSETKQIKEKNNKIKEKEIKENKNKSYSKICDFWLKEFKTDYVFSAKDGLKVKSIIKQIEKKLELQQKEITEESVVESFKWVCKNLPDFYKTQDLSVLDSKFNVIVEEIKNKRNGNSKSKQSLQSLKEQSEAVLRNFANDKN